MIECRPVSELDGSDLGWLKAVHHFRIGGFGNPAHKALGNLYVWNDDELAPGSGFPTHPHRDVEIITYVREGCVCHCDTLGNESRIMAGDVQVMSAGTGIEHAETAAPDKWTKLFQIWLRPRERGGQPHWATKSFAAADRCGRFAVLASGFAEDADVLTIRADARVLGARLAAGQRLVHHVKPGRKAYLVPTTGSITVNSLKLEARDGAALQDEDTLRIEALGHTEIVLVETT